jgi:hypothetical protein
VYPDEGAEEFTVQSDSWWGQWDLNPPISWVHAGFDSFQEYGEFKKAKMESNE